MLYNTSMRLFNDSFGTVPKIELIIVGAIAFALLVLLISIFAISERSQNGHSKEIKQLVNSTRTYIIDVRNDKVNYFNLFYLRSRKALSITTFYNQYAQKDREKLIQWIGDLLDKDTQTPKYLETNVYIKSNKAYVPTILEVQKIEYEKQLIFIESHILQTEYKAHRRGDKLVFDKRDYLNKKILMSNGKGATLFFNFYNKITKTSDISQLVYADLRDIILSFSDDDILIVEEKIGQIIVTNFNIKTKSEILTFIDDVSSKINRFLTIKSYSDDILYSVGVIENNENFRDVNALVKNVISLSELCKDTNEKVAFFSEKKMVFAAEHSNEYASDVQSIIEENRITYLFQPIIDIDKRKIIAYKATFKPNDKLFEEMENLKNYAIRTHEDRELFSTIVRNAISRFVQEKNDYGLKLLLPISFNELSYAAQSLGGTDGVSDVNLVLSLKENDLSSLPDDYEEEKLIDSIRALKSKGYSVALDIDDDVLTLSPEFYSVFDYFNLSVISHIHKKNAGKNLPSFQGLIEKLLHYNKPIVAFDIQNWDNVELVYKLGVSIICCDVIAQPAANIMPIQKKILTKIYNLKS